MTALVLWVVKIISDDDKKLGGSFDFHSRPRQGYCLSLIQSTHTNGPCLSG